MLGGRLEAEDAEALEAAEHAVALPPEVVGDHRAVERIDRRGLRPGRPGAGPVLERDEQEEVAAREKQYQRAPGWPPRVQAWLADVYSRMDDVAAADRARAASVELWRAVAARDTLPDDLVQEARAAVAAGTPATR